ncbi:MAG: protein kinase, partial [Myxococcota bacterium]
MPLPLSHPPRPPLPRWLGRYELVRPLGAGATGQVVEAVLHGPRGFRKRVALKLLHGGIAVDPAQVAGLVREARFGAMLSHPNVVSTLELGEVDGVWFVAMELVPGRSLSAMLRQGSLSIAALIDVGIQVCAALSHVHELVEDGRHLRLVHRDVKPGNLLLHPAGFVRLADFGVAGLTAEIAGGTAGTPGYMAPEQIDGRAEPRSDLFGLGMTLLAATTGANPLGRGIPALRATGEIEARLADPAFLAPADRLLPGLGEVLRTALRHDPDLRWPTARALAIALRALRARAIGPALAELTVDLPAPEPPPAEVAATAPTHHRREAPLIGRDAELRALTVALDAPGVWTLVGPAGVGKTRLAAERSSSGTVWCDLVRARTVPELCAAVALELGADLRDADDPIDQVGRALAARGRVVVVLDNLEQVVDAAAAAIDRWATVAPHATLLGTSRAPLRIVGETVLEVPSLDGRSAAALFGAVRGRPVDPSEQAAVEEIARRVDGLPLAIELVAVRGRVLAVDTLLARLDDQLRLSTAGPRSGDPRHRTLHAAVGWSWDLLGAGEQAT